MSPPRRLAVQLAVVGSAAAGLIHATAVGTHASEKSLVWLFALCAVAQVGIAGTALIRPTREVLLALGGINVAAFACWILSRTVGLPFPAALTEVESVGTADLVAALLAALAVSGVAAFLLRPDPKRVAAPIWTAAAIIGALVLTVPALAAGTNHVHDHGDSHEAGHAAHDDGHGSHDEAGHDDGHGSHDAAGTSESGDHSDHSDHADGSDHDDHGTEVAGATLSHDDHGSHDNNAAGIGQGHGGTGDAGHDGHDHGTNGGDQGTSTTTHGNHDHGTSTTTHGNHDHGTSTTTHGNHPTSTTTHGNHDHPTTTTTHGGHDHTTTTTVVGAPTGPIVSVDDPRLTSAQREAAMKLIADTTAAVQGYSTPALAEAAGYRSIGDSVTGYEHYVNWDYFGDRVSMDPTRIESLVFVVNPDGSRTLGSGMYILPLGKTMADVPDIAGELTTWHDHQNLCWDASGPSLQVVGVTDENGKCVRGVFFATPPMLHVWLTPQECGPFAGIEGAHGSDCSHSHAHDPTDPTGPIVTIDDPRLTPEQQAAARDLLNRTTNAMAKFSDVASVQAAGYHSIGDAGTGFEHFVNWNYYNDAIEMDENKIESVVFEVNPDGTKTIASAMYILRPGKTMADVPDIAGELTMWHDHQNLCWDTRNGNPVVVGLTRPDGTCARGAFVATPPMIHVWLTPQECGPFTGIEGTHGGTCGAHQH